MTDFQDWNAPQGHATAIAATGVPLLTASTQVTSQNKTLTAGGGTTLGPFALSQIGYEVLISASMSNAATIPFATVVMSWIESATGITIATDSFTATAANNAINPIVTVGRGPSKADSLEITLTNNDGVNTMAVNVTVLQNSRIYPRDEFYWLNQYPLGLAVPALTLASLVPDENCLGIINNVTVPASGSITRLFGVYNGPLIVGMDMHSGSMSSVKVNFSSQPDSIYGGGSELYGAVPTVNTWFIAGPRAPIKCVVNNSVTTTVALTLSLFRFA